MIRVRRYIPKYKKQVKEFIIKAHEEFGFAYNFKLDYDLEDPEEIYIKSGGEFLLLLDDNNLIGTIALKIPQKPHIAEMKRFYVDKEHRGKGYGLMLYNMIVDISKEKGVKQINLDANVIQKNAVEFYIKNEFRITEQVGNELRMTKMLN